MATVKAFMNHGRWLAQCPKEHYPHGSDTLEVTPVVDAIFICPACYPQSIASHSVVINKQITRAPDRSAQSTARIMARSAGEIYAIEYPENIDAILQILSVRPVQNQNWEPGETEEFLQEENIANAV